MSELICGKCGGHATRITYGRKTWCDAGWEIEEARLMAELLDSGFDAIG